MNDLLISHIGDLESIVRGWRTHIALKEEDAGLVFYVAALAVCAGQIEDAITRLRENVTA